MASRVIVGYDFDFIDGLPERLKCPICLCAMRVPVQTKCGHRFCSNCLSGSFRERNEKECPQDRIIVKAGGLFYDKACEREILSLQVKCKESKRGCDWTGELRYHMQDHKINCPYGDVACEDCREEMQRRKLEKHMSSECVERMVHCSYCDEEFAYRCQKNHERRKCPLFPLDCPNSCGVTKIPRKQVEAHVRDVCQKTVMPCPFKEAGCDFKNERCKMEGHIEQFTQQHLRQTFSELMKMKRELRDLKVTYGENPKRKRGENDLESNVSKRNRYMSSFSSSYSEDSDLDS